MPQDKLPVCPRCDSATTEVLTTSPVPGVWVVYRCGTCFFAWRSTEPETITNPELYDPHFKFKPADMKNFPIVPTVPELATSSTRSEP